MPTVDALIQRLSREGYALVETHISWVLLGPSDVWKLKKPVDFGFLDFTTLAARKAACEAEVELNRRLSPHVYLGAVPVVDTADGPQLGGEGEPVDWAVHMKRLVDADRADVRLAEGRLTREHIDAIAEHIAAFHAQARCDEVTASFGRAEVIGTNVRENFEQTRQTVGHYIDEAQADEVEQWQLSLLATHEGRFAARVDAGRVRDGHGDLRLEHVYIADDGELSIIDCIEFNERFRFGDVCADIAFLAMDLARLGHVELSEACLAAYARAADDFDLYSVVDFYESYRAYVRGKIATIVAEGQDTPPKVRERAAKEARRDYLLSVAAHRRSLLAPMVIVVAGIIATGKSTVAAAIGAERSAPIIEADRTRKAMVGVMPTDAIHTDAWKGAYAPGMTEKVYAELNRRAEVVVRSGRPVVLDASFRKRGYREQARALAQRLGVPFVLVECRTDPEVCRARLEERARSASVSDGRLEIFDDFVAAWETIDELPVQEHLVLDTARTISENLEIIRERAVQTWPPGLNA